MTVNGYIMVGGRSSRMGTDKGLLKVKGKYLVEYVIRHLEPCVAKLFLVGNDPAYDAIGPERIPDLVQGIGPAGGIITALSHSAVSQNFILSCDTPFVDSDLIFAILKKSEGYEICIPELKGRMEPLVGYYSKDILPRWTKGMQTGSYKLQTLIERCHYKTLDVEKDLLSDEKMFMNINTPDDLIRAEKEGRWV